MLVGQILVEWQYFFCLFLVTILGAKYVVKIFSFRRIHYIVENQCLRLPTKFIVERLWLMA